MKIKAQIVLIIMAFALINTSAIGQNNNENKLNYLKEKKPKEVIIDVSKKFVTLVIFPTEIIEDFLGNDLEYEKNVIRNESQPYNSKIVKFYYVREAKGGNNNLTNYTAITKDGNIYEILIRETDYPVSTNYEMTEDLAIGNVFYGNKGFENYKEKIEETETKNKVIGIPYNYYTKNIKTYHYQDAKDVSEKINWNNYSQSQMDSIYTINKIEYYKIRAFKNQNNKKLGKGRNFSKSSRMYLWLKGVYFNKNEIYVDLELDNRENLDYKVDFIKTMLATTYKKKSTKQSTNHKPLFDYNIPDKVEGKGSRRFQLVFDRFTISSKRTLLIEVKEKNGERDLTLKVPTSFITNPFEIK